MMSHDVIIYVDKVGIYSSLHRNGGWRADMVCRAIFRKYIGDEILILEAMKTKQDGQVPTCERIR